MKTLTAICLFISAVCATAAPFGRLNSAMNQVIRIEEYPMQSYLAMVAAHPLKARFLRPIYDTNAPPAHNSNTHQAVQINWTILTNAILPLYAIQEIPPDQVKSKLVKTQVLERIAEALDDMRAQYFTLTNGTPNQATTLGVVRKMAEYQIGIMRWMEIVTKEQ